MMRETLNHNLDRLVHLRVHIAARCVPAFQVCGYLGLALAIVLSLTLVAFQGLAYWVMAAIIVSAVLSFLAQAMLTKIITGDEELVYYRHVILVSSIAAGLLWLLRQPILPYLDATILGIGIFVACGRVGCLMVGCCHGRPSRWGVCYPAEHVEAGFPAYLVGVRLFPIQLVEAIWLLGIVLIGSALVVGHQPPGTALAFYIVAYAIGRFGFEFMRGDAERSYVFGFSEAQWTSLLLLSIVIGVELSGVLQFEWWHLVTLVGLLLVVVSFALTRHSPRAVKQQLLRAQHLKEVAQVVNLATDMAMDSATLVKHNSHPPEIRVGYTSLGIQISASKFQSAAGHVFHYALSRQNEMLTDDMARTLGELIRELRYPSGSAELIAANRGVFHFLMSSRTSTSEM